MSNRVSDYRIKEFVEGLNLDSEELVTLLEISPNELMSKFPHKMRSNLDKLGFNDTQADTEGDCE